MFRPGMLLCAIIMISPLQAAQKTMQRRHSEQSLHVSISLQNVTEDLLPKNDFLEKSKARPNRTSKCKKFGSCMKNLASCINPLVAIVMVGAAYVVGLKLQSAGDKIQTGGDRIEVQLNRASDAITTIQNTYNGCEDMLKTCVQLCGPKFSKES